jgi:hypothetical protein
MFLYEKMKSDYVKHLTEDEINNYLSGPEYTLYPDADKIFRQVNTVFNDYADFNIIDPKTIIRRSPNTNKNYTNLLVSNLPSWEKYPKRINSLICGNFERTSGHFGLGTDDLYLVVPKNNSIIGVCDYDFWDSFTSFVSVEDLNSVFNNCNDRNWFTFKKCLNNMNNEYLQEKFDTFNISYKNKKNLSVIENIDNLLNPNNNHFDLSVWDRNFTFEKKWTDYSEYAEQEVWIDSTSLLIRYDIALKMGLI